MSVVDGCGLIRAAGLRGQARHLVQLGEERRLVVRKIGQVADQDRIGTQRRGPGGQQPQPLVHLVAAMTIDRIEVRTIDVDADEQALPELQRHGREPFVVGGAVEHFLQQVRQEPFPDVARQQAAEQAARQVAEETAVAELIGVRVGQSVHAARQQPAHMGRERAGVGRVSFEQRHETHESGLSTRGAGRPQACHQPPQPIDVRCLRLRAQLVQQCLQITGCVLIQGFTHGARDRSHPRGAGGRRAECASAQAIVRHSSRGRGAGPVPGPRRVAQEPAPWPNRRAADRRTAAR